MKLDPCITSSVDLNLNELWTSISEAKPKLLEENIGGILHHVDLSIVFLVKALNAQVTVIDKSNFFKPLSFYTAKKQLQRDKPTI